MIIPAWTHQRITAGEYESWSEEQCAGIEIVDGMVVVSPGASKRHNRLVKILAVALEAAAGAAVAVADVDAAVGVLGELREERDAVLGDPGQERLGVVGPADAAGPAGRTSLPAAPTSRLG